MDSKQVSTCCSQLAPDHVAPQDPVADAASGLVERDLALRTVSALRAGFDELDRIVAASRANAERMLDGVEAWAKGGAVPELARRYADYVRNEGDVSEYSCDFDIHQVAAVALHGVGVGDASFFVAALKEMGDEWNRHDDLYIRAGDAARAAFIAAMRRRAATNA